MCVCVEHTTIQCQNKCLGIIQGHPKKNRSFENIEEGFHIKKKRSKQQHSSLKNISNNYVNDVCGCKCFLRHNVNGGLYTYI